MVKSVIACDFLVALLLAGVWTISGQRQCPRLQKPWNGQFVGRCERHVGAECQFACREPYRLVGSRVRLCRTDGTWSGRTSACELETGCNNCNGCNNCGNCDHNNNNCDSTCPSLYSVENGQAEGQCSPGVLSQTCTFRCNSGFALEGQSRITCLSGGQWSSQIPYCRRTSGALCESFVIPNGEASCLLEGGVTVCRASCQPGYMLVGSSLITCSSSGNWNEQYPECRRSAPDVTPICPSLVASEGGRLVGSCSAASTGDTCQMVCLGGYRPTDMRVLVCQAGGQWSNTLPRCIANGCPPFQVTQGTTSGQCNPGNPGQSCSVTCQPGYTLVGSSTLICQADGQWSTNIPSCTVRSCPAMPSPAYGGSSGSCNPGQVGQSCTFFCNSGYQLVGASTLVCGNDGRWSANAPVCSASARCPDLPPPNNGANSGQCRQATAGQTCIFSCQAGYFLTGQSTVQCGEGGRWSGNIPVCTRPTPEGCSSLVPPLNGHMQGTCAPGRVGEQCVFSCDSRFEVRGQRVVMCQPGGRWSDYAPRCERIEVEDGRCPVLTPPPHSDFEECDNHVGGRCIVVCERGYLRAGSRVRTCLAGGMWSGYSPTCTRRNGYTTTYTYKVVPLWSLVFG